MVTRGSVVLLATAACTATAPGPDLGPPDEVSTTTETVTISVRVDGVGRVTSEPAGIACPGQCEAQFAAGTRVTLVAAASDPGRFLGWDGGRCATEGSCEVRAGDNEPIAARFTGTHNVAFLTSSLHSPAGLSLADADAACNARASEVGLGGTYVAWMSMDGASAIDRLGPTANGWLTIDGLPFAASRDDLVAGNIHYPVRYNELGQANGQMVYTGTNRDGTSSGLDCGGWQDDTAVGTTGLVDLASSGFTSSYAFPCFLELPLYCFGIDHATPPAVIDHRGKRAFVSTPWAPGGGLADADAHCQGEADAAGLAGHFQALLAVSGSTADSRFSAVEGPWVRPDGTRVATHASTFGNRDLLAPINQRADGTYADEAYAFTGSATANCADWTDTDYHIVRAGQIQRALFYWDTMQWSCGDALPLYCLETARGDDKLWGDVSRSTHTLEP